MTTTMREPASVNVFSPQDLKLPASSMKTKCRRQDFTRSTLKQTTATTYRNHTRRHHSLPLKKFLINAYLTILLLCLIHQKQEHPSSSTSGPLLAEAQLRIQHDNKLSWEVSENAPNGTFVGTIRSNDGQTPTFIITEPPGLENELRAAFNFNLLTGDITTNGVLDREQREFYLFVAIFKEFSEVRCTIKVRDVNDNAPYFVTNETEYVVEVPENLVARFQLPLVMDADASPNAIREIRILSTNAPKGSFTAVGHDAPVRSSLGQNSNLGLPNEDSSSQFTSGIDNPLLAQQFAQQEFSLMITQPVGSSSSSSSVAASTSSAAAAGSPAADNMQSSMSSSGGNSAAPNSDTPSRYQADLEVVRPLDRENQSSYQLTLEALDGGTPPKSTRLKVLVHVLDVNDNDPVFSSKLYKQAIKEDTLKHKPLFRVEAHDADLDSNGQISYFYKRHQSTSQAPANVINTNTNTNSSDNNNNELSSTTSSTRIAAATTNSNNNLSKQRLQQQQQQQMISGGGGGKFAQRQAANTDSYENLAPLMSPNSMTQQQQDLTFPYRTRQQANYPADQYFDVDMDKGEIFLVRELDYETEQVHEFVIEARDHGKPPRSSNTTVRITVLDVPDDPPISKQLHDDRRPANNGNNPNNNINVNLNGGETTGNSRADASAMARSELDSIGQHQFNFQNFNLMNWFAQMNSSLLFVIVLVALFSVAFPVCLVKIKSRQPESDYNDTANLNPNSGATKSSPNHSANNIDHSTLGSGHDSLHYRHHDQSLGRHTNHSGPYPPGSGGIGLDGSPLGPFGTPNGGGKMSRYPYLPESSNFYHNLPYPPQQRARHHSSTSHHMAPDSPTEHQMAVGGSRGGTMNHLHNHSHHSHHLLGHNMPAGSHHHSMDTHTHNHHHNHQSAHHHQQFAANQANHTTSSLTYAHHHSRAALLHQAHHHQSTHQLANATIGSNGGTGGAGGGICANVAGVCGHNKGGTMNSQHSNAAHPAASGSPIPATPNTTHSSGLPMTIHEVHPASLAPITHHQHAANNQLPPTPCGLQSGATAASVFQWPPTTTDSAIGCYPPASAGLPPCQVSGPNGGGSGSGGSGGSGGGGCGGGHATGNGTTTTAGSLDSCGTPVVMGTSGGGGGPIANQPLDRWFDLGVTSQLVYSHDWFGSYNWDYLTDWTPQYNNLMPIICEDAPGF